MVCKVSDRLLSREEAAALASVSVRTFTRSIAQHLSKVHPSPGLTRYRESDVLQYLANQTEKPEAQKRAPRPRASNIERAVAANPAAAKLLRALEKRNAA